MKFTRSHSSRALARSLALSLGTALLIGCGGFQAHAQGTDTTDKTTKAAGTTPDAPAPRTAPMPLGDEVISQTQTIKSSFVISVTVVGEPDPSGQYAVDQAGNINMKYAGIMTPVKVVGKTPEQAAAAITDFLKTYVKNPQVSVIIVAIPRPIIFIGGAVRISGPLQIGSEVTLIDALSRAEPTENADLSRVTIYRKQKSGNDEKTVPITVNFEKFFRPAPGETPDDSQNIVLKDKDRIVIPTKTRPGQGVISVFGEVEKTQRDIPLPSTQTLTVREAINLVGGTRQNANRKAVIVRRVGEDRPLVIDLDKAEQGDLVNNITLRPDDTVYVEKLENNAYININGGLVKPGKLVYDKRTTLTQAIMEAGGVAPFAHEKNGVIYRHPDNDAKRTQVIQFNFKDISKGKAQDIELQPGDSVFIESGQPSRTRDLLDYVSLIGSVGYLSYLFR